MLFNDNTLKTNIFGWTSDAFKDLPLQDLKYYKYKRAMKNIPEVVHPLIEKMLCVYEDMGLVWDDKDNPEGYTLLIDYKIRDVKTGKCTCGLEGWHIDVVRNPNHNEDSDYHLIYTTEVGTEFLLNKIAIEKSDTTFHDALKRFADSQEAPEIHQALPDTVSLFKRLQLHRGAVAEKDHRRMLVRLTLTKVIK